MKLMLNNWTDVANIDEIPDQECKIVEINDMPIAVFNLEGNYYAIEDNCPHQHLPLADGIVEDSTITCPYHGAMFSIITGEVLSPPACDNLRTFITRVHEGKVQVKGK